MSPPPSLGAKRTGHRPHHIGGSDAYAMLEFRSPFEPRMAIPLSEGGYRSFFAPMHEIEAAPSVEIYAAMVALLLSAERCASGKCRADHAVSASA
jgi:hypothetical protein